MRLLLAEDVEVNREIAVMMLNDMGFIENELRLPLVPTRIATKQKMSEILRTLNI